MSSNFGRYVYEVYTISVIHTIKQFSFLLKRPYFALNMNIMHSFSNAPQDLVKKISKFLTEIHKLDTSVASSVVMHLQDLFSCQHIQSTQLRKECISLTQKAMPQKLTLGLFKCLENKVCEQTKFFIIKILLQLLRRNNSIHLFIL